MINYTELTENVNAISPSIGKQVEQEISSYLDRCGLFYKIFSRIKTGASLSRKIEYKQEEKGDNYKLQDLVGVRIVVYFKEDIDLCEQIILKNFEYIDVTRDAQTTDSFKPQRINYVCRMPGSIRELFDESIWNYPIDQTFEIQIRTVFSEGWHEIEHDFRYKCKQDWEKLDDLGRALNGVFATLENCDWSISSILDQAAHYHYKNGNWIPMLKNSLRIRIREDGNMEEIIAYFNSHPLAAKNFLKMDRKSFLSRLALNQQSRIPLQLSNLVYLINLWEVGDPNLSEMTPDIVKQIGTGIMAAGAITDMSDNRKSEK